MATQKLNELRLERNPSNVSTLHIFSVIPLVSLVCGFLIAVIWKMPGFSDHAWLAYRHRDIPEEEDCVDHWSPLLQVNQIDR
jgi:NADH:ubiquinone oxidoreductase subunit 4 (subunit M)